MNEIKDHNSNYKLGYKQLFKKIDLFNSTVDNKDQSKVVNLESSVRVTEFITTFKDKMLLPEVVLYLNGNLGLSWDYEDVFFSEMEFIDSGGIVFSFSSFTDKNTGYVEFVSPYLLNNNLTGEINDVKNFKEIMVLLNILDYFDQYL